ncbi:MAG TPA: tetratricopeptide repeat protein [Candidatus Hydrogenedentes bacterium]|nr:tetratricopeptide repeat protein [Candidatus Hydrogenedentota bacterium]
MRFGKHVCWAVLALVSGGLCLDAGAELNLWVSYYFAGEDRFGAGDFKEAETLLVNGLSETKTAYRQGETLDALGRVYTSQGRYDDAEKAFQEALCLKRKSLGGRHREVAVSLNNLADLYYVWGKEDKPESLYRDALDIHRRDQLNVEVCRALNGLALIHNARGEFVEAEELLKRAIEAHEKAQRREHPFLATVLVNLGILYTNQGRYEEAGPLFDRAAYIQDQVLRADHPDVAVRLHGTSALYHATGRAKEAVACASRAQVIRNKQAEAGNAY